MQFASDDAWLLQIMPLIAEDLRGSFFMELTILLMSVDTIND
jgi:hypothetical protein